MPPNEPPQNPVSTSSWMSLFPGQKTPNMTRELLTKLPRYRVYGLMLTPERDHPFTKLITARWDDLHALTGERMLVLAFKPPKGFSREFKSFWRKELGKDFSDIWDKWVRSSDARSSYNFVNTFQDRRILRTEMPCLALFTAPDAQRAVILRIPDWSNDDVWTYLKAVFDTIDKCARLADPEARFDALRHSLTSFPARAKTILGHLTTRATDYVREHPIKVMASTMSVIIALANASLIPIGAAGIIFMKDILGIVKSTSQDRPGRMSRSRFI